MDSIFSVRVSSLLLPFLIVGLFPLYSYGQQLKKTDKRAILSVLNSQNEEWNKGNLDGFMVGYLESDSLMFIGKKGPTYGYQATLDNYKKSYPSPEKMGKLTFTILKMRALGKKNALVIGKWELDRKTDKLEGHFSLNWEKIKGEWVIISDHSS